MRAPQEPTHGIHAVFGRQPRTRVASLVRQHAAPRLLDGEAHVVKLDLVKALERGFAGKLNVVLPDLGAERIDPEAALSVAPRLLRQSILDRYVHASLCAILCQQLVSEHDDPRDGVEATLLERGHQLVHVRDGRLGVGADLLGQRDGALVGELAPVALHVDHHGVDVRAV